MERELAKCGSVLICPHNSPKTADFAHIFLYRKYPQIWTSTSKHAESRLADFCYPKKTQKSISLSRATTRWLVLLPQLLLRLKRQWSKNLTQASGSCYLRNKPYKSTLSELRSLRARLFFCLKIDVSKFPRSSFVIIITVLSSFYSPNFEGRTAFSPHKNYSHRKKSHFRQEWILMYIFKIWLFTKCTKRPVA